MESFLDSGLVRDSNGHGDARFKVSWVGFWGLELRTGSFGCFRIAHASLKLQHVALEPRAFATPVRERAFELREPQKITVPGTDPLIYRALNPQL